MLYNTNVLSVVCYARYCMPVDLYAINLLEPMMRFSTRGYDARQHLLQQIHSERRGTLALLVLDGVTVVGTSV